MKPKLGVAGGTRHFRRQPRTDGQAVSFIPQTKKPNKFKVKKKVRFNLEVHVAPSEGNWRPMHNLQQFDHGATVRSLSSIDVPQTGGGECNVLETQSIAVCVSPKTVSSKAGEQHLADLLYPGTSPHPSALLGKGVCGSGECMADASRRNILRYLRPFNLQRANLRLRLVNKASSVRGETRLLRSCMKTRHIPRTCCVAPTPTPFPSPACVHRDNERPEVGYSRFGIHDGIFRRLEGCALDFENAIDTGGQDSIDCERLVSSIGELDISSQKTGGHSQVFHRPEQQYNFPQVPHSQVDNSSMSESNIINSNGPGERPQRSEFDGNAFENTDFNNNAVGRSVHISKSAPSRRRLNRGKENAKRTTKNVRSHSDMETRSSLLAEANTSYRRCSSNRHSSISNNDNSNKVTRSSVQQNPSRAVEYHRVHTSIFTPCSGGESSPSATDDVTDTDCTYEKFSCSAPIKQRPFDTDAFPESPKSSSASVEHDTEQIYEIQAPQQAKPSLEDEHTFISPTNLNHIPADRNSTLESTSISYSSSSKQAIEIHRSPERGANQLTTQIPLTALDHGGDCIYLCPVLNCSMTFSGQGVLQQHLSEHQHSPCNPFCTLTDGAGGGTLGYLCPQCGHVFKCEEECVAHMTRSRHSSMMSPIPFSVYACPTCLHFFPSYSKTVEHMDNTAHHRASFSFEVDVALSSKATPIPVPCRFMEELRERCSRVPYTLQCENCQGDITTTMDLECHTQKKHVVVAKCRKTVVDVVSSLVTDQACAECQQFIYTGVSRSCLVIHSSCPRQGPVLANRARTLKEFIRRCGISGVNIISEYESCVSTGVSIDDIRAEETETSGVTLDDNIEKEKSNPPFDMFTNCKIVNGNMQKARTVMDVGIFARFVGHDESNNGVEEDMRICEDATCRLRENQHGSYKRNVNVSPLSWDTSPGFMVCQGSREMATQTSRLHSVRNDLLEEYQPCCSHHLNNYDSYNTTTDVHSSAGKLGSSSRSTLSSGCPHISSGKCSLSTQTPPLEGNATNSVFDVQSELRASSCTSCGSTSGSYNTSIESVQVGSNGGLLTIQDENHSVLEERNDTLLRPFKENKRPKLKSFQRVVKNKMLGRACPYQANQQKSTPKAKRKTIANRPDKICFSQGHPLKRTNRLRSSTSFMRKSSCSNSSEPVCSIRRGSPTKIKDRAYTSTKLRCFQPVNVSENKPRMGRRRIIAKRPIFSISKGKHACCSNKKIPKVSERSKLLRSKQGLMLPVSGDVDEVSEILNRYGSKASRLSSQYQPTKQVDYDGYREYDIETERAEKELPYQAIPSREPSRYIISPQYTANVDDEKYREAYSMLNSKTIKGKSTKCKNLKTLKDQKRILKRRRGADNDDGRSDDEGVITHTITKTRSDIENSSSNLQLLSGESLGVVDADDNDMFIIVDNAFGCDESCYTVERYYDFNTVRFTVPDTSIKNHITQHTVNAELQASISSPRAADSDENNECAEEEMRSSVHGRDHVIDISNIGNDERNTDCVIEPISTTNEMFDNMNVMASDCWQVTADQGASLSSEEDSDGIIQVLQEFHNIDNPCQTSIPQAIDTTTNQAIDTTINRAIATNINQAVDTNINHARPGLNGTRPQKQRRQFLNRPATDCRMGINLRSRRISQNHRKGSRRAKTRRKTNWRYNLIPTLEHGEHNAQQNARDDHRLNDATYSSNNEEIEHSGSSLNMDLDGPYCAFLPNGETLDRGNEFMAKSFRSLVSPKIKDLSAMQRIIFADLENVMLFNSFHGPWPEQSFLWGFLSQRPVRPYLESYFLKFPLYVYLKSLSSVHVSTHIGRVKNAVDVVITMCIAKLDERLPRKIPFYIVSNDKWFQGVSTQLGSSRTVRVVTRKRERLFCSADFIC